MRIEFPHWCPNCRSFQESFEVDQSSRTNIRVGEIPVADAVQHGQRLAFRDPLCGFRYEVEVQLAKEGELLPPADPARRIPRVAQGGEFAGLKQEEFIDG